MAQEPVVEKRSYSASEFTRLYKIPIEFAMLEIINFSVMWGGASSFMQPFRETSE
jgi:hypothetical protein